MSEEKDVQKTQPKSKIVDVKEKVQANQDEEAPQLKWKHGVTILANEFLTEFKIIPKVEFEGEEIELQEMYLPLLIEKYHILLQENKQRQLIGEVVVNAIINGKVSVEGREISIPDLFSHVNIEAYKTLMMQAQLAQKNKIIHTNH